MMIFVTEDKGWEYKAKQAYHMKKYKKKEAHCIRNTLFSCRNWITKTSDYTRVWLIPLTMETFLASLTTLAI